MQSRRFLWLLALLVALFAAHALLLEHQIFGDGVLRAEAVRALALEGRLTGARYSIVGPMFAAPLCWLDALLGTGDALLSRYNLILLAIGTAVLMRAIARSQALGARSNELAATFGVLVMTASMFPFAATTFYGETFSAVTIGLGLYGLTVGWRLRAWTLLVLGVCNTPPLLLPLAMIAGLRAIAAKDLRPLLVPVITLSLVLLENLLRRGDIGAFGYAADGKGPPGLMPYTGLGGFSYPLLLGVYGLLLSPGVGLLFYAPGLFLLGMGKGPGSVLRATVRLWLLFIAGTVLAYAKWWCWHGMVYWGPRYLLLAVFPTCLLLAWFARRHDLSLRANLLTLVVLTGSFWVGANGAAHLFRGLELEPALTAADGVPCLYAPEMSALVYPFLKPSLPRPEAWGYLALVLVAFAAIAGPVALRVLRQLPEGLSRLRASWVATVQARA
ncbi:MAG: hypothetical protein AB7O97_04575 [Planctomycetota bacterium]